MFERTITDEDLQRLTAERIEADRRYNAALTALDAALHGPPDVPAPPPAFDETEITPLNERWQVVPEGPTLGLGWRQRLAGLIWRPVGRLFQHPLAEFVWRLVGPFFERQQAFNSAVVDHVNRNVGTHREAAPTLAAMLAALRDEFASLAAFQTRLILYLQQVTPFVETKDRELAARMHQLTLGLSAGLTDEILKRWESMLARERHLNQRLTALDETNARALGDFRQEFDTTMATVMRATAAFKREMERVLSSGMPVPATIPAAAGKGAGTGKPAAPPGAPPTTGALESYKYLAFEDCFRGSPEDIRERMADYVAEFAGASDVLDIGCGRGEFLDLLRQGGVSARGVDINHEMVEVSRGRGLDVVEGDALAYLTSLPDESLGGIIAAQVVEHLQPDYLLALLDTAHRKLRPGSKIILETINAACWYAFFASYIRDVTHVRPLHPDTLQYLVTASGFQRADIRYRMPVSDAEKLQAVPLVPPSDGSINFGLTELVVTANENAAKLNRLLFTYLDYAVVAVRP